MMEYRTREGQKEIAEVQKKILRSNSFNQEDTDPKFLLQLRL
jgi:hypothetical protein